ncbi:MAG TPA: hypothetical protein VNO55_29885 [Polyangia bacterium]|nr:hypothetical protein [Polyangia bacterium]
MPTEITSRGRSARPWLWTVVMLASAQASPGEATLGQALFTGARPLAAHVAGQDFALPQDAVACTNCHQGQPPNVFGPPLTRATLTRARARRGGPASVYDDARFCRALRDGIDPALVVIPQTMPRYAFSDPQCRALWAFLLTRS